LVTRLGWAAVRGVHTVGLVTMLGKGQPPTFRFKIDVSGHVWVPLGIACYLRRCCVEHPAGFGH